MPLPQLAESGDLPHGVHKATLSEIVERFGQASDRRKVLALRLERIHRIAAATGHLVRFVVFGSFVTAKVGPNDVDVFIIMADDFAIGKLVGESRLLFEHTAAQTTSGVASFGSGARRRWAAKKQRSKIGK
jgi:hypothetical protein